MYRKNGKTQLITDIAIKELQVITEQEKNEQKRLRNSRLIHDRCTKCGLPLTLRFLICIRCLPENS